jgi:hypothetical protein
MSFERDERDSIEGKNQKSELQFTAPAEESMRDVIIVVINPYPVHRGRTCCTGRPCSE